MDAFANIKIESSVQVDRRMMSSLSRSRHFRSCLQLHLTIPQSQHSYFSIIFNIFAMASRLMTMRSARFLSLPRRSLNTTSRFQTNNVNHRSNDTAEEYRRYQMEKPLNPHMTNTNSTISNEMPSVGKDSAPPEMITAVDGDFVPKDSVPENTERMVGGQQSTESNKESNQELEVGEMAGASFKVEPKRREGEDMNTLRARLLRP